MKPLNLALLVLLALSPVVSADLTAQGHALTASSRPRTMFSRVSISPTTMQNGSTSLDISATTWTARGFDLKSLIAQIYDLDLRRIDVPDSGISRASYDVTLALNGGEDQEAITLLLKDALEKRFSLHITPESREMDVYVLTAPHGAGPALRPHVFTRPARSRGLLQNVSLGASGSSTSDQEQFTYEGQTCASNAWGRISATAGTVSQFGHTLEPNLDRLLIDETRLAGSFDFQTSNFKGTEELFQVLRDQLGLVIVKSRRSVTIFAVRVA